jgi:phytoene synthase
MSDSTVDHATAAINAGSQSFAAAARLFDGPTRRSAVMLYSWCRHCDDVIDGQVLGHGQVGGDRHGAAERLAELEQQTRRVYRGDAITDPNFRALAEVVRRHAIPQRFPLEHLDGFRMDVEGQRFLNLEDTLRYSYAVAGVVGIMMALIMGVRDEDVLDRACDLGIAFQLTNIVRDVVEDAQIGRVYLPEAWLAEEGVPTGQVAAPQHRPAVAACASRLLETADLYYESAGAGIPALPLRSAWAIATARGVYRRIGEKVIARGAAAWDSRTRTGRRDKLRHVIGGAALALASRRGRPAARNPALWARPR